MAPFAINYAMLFFFPPVIATAACTDLFGRRRWGRPVAVVAVALLIGLIAVERAVPFNPLGIRRIVSMARSYPLFEVPSRDDAVTQQLRQASGPLLELPIAYRGVPDPIVNARAMYRSLFHDRPVLNGYSGYWPSGFTDRLAFASALPAEAAIDGLQRLTSFSQVLLNVDRMSKEDLAEWKDVAGGSVQRLRLAFADPDYLLFDVVSP